MSLNSESKTNIKNLSSESKTNIKNYLHPFDIVYLSVGCALNPINKK